MDLSATNDFRIRTSHRIRCLDGQMDGSQCEVVKVGEWLDGRMDV